MQKEVITDLFEFLDNSPTPYHAVQQTISTLQAQGFNELHEKNHWNLSEEGQYYVVREGSVIAFRTAGSDLREKGFRLVGAHTDSPCLKVKPNAYKEFQNYRNLNVETYGGVLLMTWFDRDLSIAGRVSGLSSKGTVVTELVDFKRPVALVPNLCIHLNRTANDGHSINKQEHTSPLFLQFNDEEGDFDFKKLLLKQVHQQKAESTLRQILEYDLCLYDTQKAGLVGLNNEFIASARLDNLLSCYCALQAFINSSPNQPALIVFNDHEEVGSQSTSGAAGPFLEAVLRRLYPEVQDFERMIHQSFLMSADNAHAIHPNYQGKHDLQHGPTINKGPAIKINDNQRYASTDLGCATLIALAHKHELPYQRFVNRSDLGCGSTIGPISSTRLGIPTLDIGLPTFAMHSIRETGGAHDVPAMISLMKAWFNRS